jgi:hypothetical protein
VYTNRNRNTDDTDMTALRDLKGAFQIVAGRWGHPPVKRLTAYGETGTVSINSQHYAVRKPPL